MNEVTRILNAMVANETVAAQQLLPAVYEELRRLARYRMASESPDHTLQPTALVHEAWIRLVAPGQQTWENRAHFFSAAAEAMRRILVEHARRKLSQKRGGGIPAAELDENEIILTAPPDELMAVHEALERLVREDPPSAELVKLRYFAGLSVEQAGQAIGIPRATAYRYWTYARAWLRCELLPAGDAD